METTTNERVERLANKLREVAHTCGGCGAEVWAINFLRAYSEPTTDEQRVATASALDDILAALDIVTKEQRDR